MTDQESGRRIDFARWRSDSPSGGNRYDDELAAAVRKLGPDLREHLVPGPWPNPGHHDREQFARLLVAGHDWLVDNIVGSAAPEAITAAVADGRHVSLLVHYFPSDDVSLSSSDQDRLAAAEAVAVSASSRVVVTSNWAAEEVASRYGRNDAVVARPGVQPAGVAPGSAATGQPPMLLWLGRLTRDKDPLTLVEALTRLRDHDWTARLVGPDTSDASLNREVHDRISQADLGGRVRVLGPKYGDALDAIWAGTDLLVHTSRAETYGMVVGEALARGIPSVVAKGTGAVEAQRVGTTFTPGDVGELADRLRTWLTDGQLRQGWRGDAIDLRRHLPSWADTAEVVVSTLLE